MNLAGNNPLSYEPRDPARQVDRRDLLKLIILSAACAVLFSTTTALASQLIRLPDPRRSASGVACTFGGCFRDDDRAGATYSVHELNAMVLSGGGGKMCAVAALRPAVVMRSRRRREPA
jgi:hypothetical protein